MTKGERIVAEVLGTDKPKGEPIMTANHPFLRKVILFAQSRRYWIGSATELLEELGDSTTPPNTVTKLLNKYDFDCFYRKHIIVRFRRTNRKRLIEFTNYRYKQ